MAKAKENKATKKPAERPFPAKPFANRLAGIVRDVVELRNEKKADNPDYLEHVARSLNECLNDSLYCLDTDAKIYRDRLERQADNMLVKDYRLLANELRTEKMAAQAEFRKAVGETMQWVKEKHCDLTYGYYGAADGGNKDVWKVYYETLFGRSEALFAAPRPANFAKILEDTGNLVGQNEDLYVAFCNFYGSAKKKA